MGNPREVTTPACHERVRDRTRRVGDFIVTVESRRVVRHAIVEYAWIVAACDVVDDPDPEAPWVEYADDGNGHAFVAAMRLDGPPDTICIRRGYVPYSDASDGRRGVVVLDDAKAIAAEAYAHFRDYVGCSKQVARERAAESLARRIDQVADWYRHGWAWYGVTLDYMGHHASCWAIDDADYARRDVVPEVAAEVADALEEEGYTVAGRPDPAPSPWSARRRLDDMRRRCRAAYPQEQAP